MPMYTNEQIWAEIYRISKMRNLQSWDNEFNQRVGIVQKHIARLLEFANKQKETRASKAVRNTANLFQQELNTAILQRDNNN